MDELEEILLETLSFYDTFTTTQILLQMDQNKIERLRNVSMMDLEKKLDFLTAQKKLVQTKINGENSWKRLLRRTKKPWWSNLF